MVDMAKRLSEEILNVIGLLKTNLEYQKALGIRHIRLPEQTMQPFKDVPTKAHSIQLEDVRRELGDCRRCKLHVTRKNIVFGTGNQRAHIVFVGEAPGRDEDIQGKPFVGQAGKLLDLMLEAINLKREEVYICNIIKCRPPGNRNPEKDEIEACGPFLTKQLEAIEPRIICALGALAAHTLLKTKESISKLRGVIHTYHGIRLIPTYHPAFLLRNPYKKREAWEDMQLIQKEYERIRDK